MSDGSSKKAGGIVLLAAALLGVIAISIFSPSGAGIGTAPARGDAQRPTAPGSTTPDTSPEPRGRARDSVAMLVVPSAAPVIEHIESPFSPEETDSVAALCAATVRADLAAHGGDTIGVETGERYGVHPVPGTGRDSLVVDGIAHGRDATPAVWHCAATTTVESRHGILRFVVEDGWPGVVPRFQAAHPINVTAEDLCLQRTKPLFPESDFRSVKRWRAADTLHVTGETMPINSEDLSGDFHCRALVRNGAIVSVVSESGRD